MSTTTSATPTTQPRVRPQFRRSLYDALAMFALFAVGTVGFHNTFGGWYYLVTCLGGALLGIVVVALCSWWRLGALPGVALTLVMYIGFGTLLALPRQRPFGVPTLEALAELSKGLIEAWKQLLTITTPVAELPALLVVPYSMSIAFTASAVAIAWFSRKYLLALVFPALFLVASILMGTQQAVAPQYQAATFVFIALVWSTWRYMLSQRLGRSDESGSGLFVAGTQRVFRVGRIVAGALTLVATVAAIVVAGQYVAPQGVRYVLRDDIVPPQAFENIPSPLAGQRAFYKLSPTKPIVSIEGTLPATALVRIATLDNYNGIVMDVAGTSFASATETDSGAFKRIASRVNEPAAGTAGTVKVTIGSYDKVWVPDIGALRGITFAGARSGALQGSLSYNAVTGTVFSQQPLAPGDTYTLDFVAPPKVAEGVLAKTPLAKVTLPAPTNVPTTVITAAAEWTADLKTPYDKVKAISDRLRTTGFFSHGLDESGLAPPGHSAVRLGRMIDPDETTDKFVGDSEQYAVMAALMMRSQGIPARVVLGFKPKTGIKNPVFIGNDVEAWVEVAFEGQGWVPFYPTPDENREPNNPRPRPKPLTQANVVQPPPPKAEIPEAPPVASADAPKKKAAPKPPAPAGTSYWVYAGYGVGGLVALFLVFAAVIIGLKGIRRWRRRSRGATLQQFEGGWHEVRDLAVDLGRPLPQRATRQEVAAVLQQEFPDARVATLARHTDVGIFGPGEPGPEAVTDQWNKAAHTMAEMTGGTTPWQRFTAKLSLRSLRRKPNVKYVRPKGTS